MSRFLPLLLVLSVIHSSIPEGGIEDNKAVNKFLGTWYFIYSWPAPAVSSDNLPECSEIQFISADYTLDEPYTCKCRRRFPNLGIVRQTTRYNPHSWIVLVDIVKTPQDAVNALEDDCVCDPYIELAYAVFRKVRYGCFIYYEMKSEEQYGYLLCQPPFPSNEEFKEIVESSKELKRYAGRRMCNY